VHVLLFLSPERKALLEMAKVCETWAKGDSFMVIGDNLDGERALAAYRESKEAAERAAGLCPTEGYFNVEGTTRIELGAEGNAVLDEIILAAEEEIRRRNYLVELIQKGEVELSLHQAESALQVSGACCHGTIRGYWFRVQSFGCGLNLKRGTINSRNCGTLSDIQRGRPQTNARGGGE
jgi:hypothetical protein